VRTTSRRAEIGHPDRGFPSDTSRSGPAYSDTRERRPPLKIGRVFQTIVLTGLIALPAGPALAQTPRKSAYYEVWCNLGTDREFQAESFSVSAYQPDKTPGGKDTGIEHYNANNPFGDVCVVLGPFTPTRASTQ
jgi:hypothetical protein